MRSVKTHALLMPMFMLQIAGSFPRVACSGTCLTFQQELEHLRSSQKLFRELRTLLEQSSAQALFRCWSELLGMGPHF